MARSAPELADQLRRIVILSLPSRAGAASSEASRWCVDGRFGLVFCGPILNKILVAAEAFSGSLLSMSLALLQSLPAAGEGSLDVGAAESAKRRATELVAANWQTAAGQAELDSERVRSSGLPALDSMLPSGGLPVGRVIELAASGSAWGTRLGLSMCRVAQQQAKLVGGSGWCAFIDPSASLYAPGAVSLGVELDRLLVVRPSWEVVERIAIRVAESRVFSVLVVDTVGLLPNVTARSHSSRWQRTVKRLALAIRGTGAQVVLLTDQAQVRPLPLPVGLRLELEQLEPERLWVRVAKEKRGRVGSQRIIRWDGMPSANSRLLGYEGSPSVGGAQLAKCPAFVQSEQPSLQS